MRNFHASQYIVYKKKRFDMVAPLSLPSVLLPPVVGPEDFDFAVDLVMEVISHPTLNRHLVYSLLDAVVETAFPEVRTPDLQHHLLTAMRSEGQA